MLSPLQRRGTTRKRGHCVDAQRPSIQLKNFARIGSLELEFRPTFHHFLQPRHWHTRISTRIPYHLFVKKEKEKARFNSESRYKPLLISAPKRTKSLKKCTARNKYSHCVTFNQISTRYDRYGSLVYFGLGLLNQLGFGSCS